MVIVTRLPWLALGAVLGYILRQPPVCEREHLPRHLDPAIVNREGDAGILPPDPRVTWTLPPPTVWGTGGNTPTWPETLEHDFNRAPHVAGAWGPVCPRCDADWWLHHRGARRA